MIQSKNWIPHNLPPRSEFIGREVVKALVHEALHSRSCLISIEGIGGIGKTSLALEVAHECLQVSQYMRQLSQTPIAPETVFAKEILDLPPQLHNRLQNTLLKCGPFDSEVELQAMFVDARISPWRDTFPEVHNRVSRVNVLINELLHHFATTGENALLLFLHVLTEHASAGDACHSDLTELAAEFELILQDQRKAPNTYPQPTYLPPSLDVQKTARFEGFIWITITDRDFSLNDLLDVVARTLDYPIIAQHRSIEKRLAVRKLLQSRPCLLVVDNFSTDGNDAIYEFLRDLPEPSKALATTREQNLRDVYSIPLAGLTEAEFMLLIKQQSRRQRVRALECAEEDELQKLYQATAGSPLATKWAIGQIQARVSLLPDVLRALQTAPLADYKPIFELSWKGLRRNARRVLMIMPFFVKPVPKDRIASLCKIEESNLDRAIERLVRKFLLDVPDDVRQQLYSIHPLMRTFVITKHSTDAEFIHSALDRLLVYYQNLFTSESSVDIPLYTLYWVSLQNYDKAPIFEREADNLIHVLHWALETECKEQALRLFVSVVHFFHIEGFWGERLELSKKMLEVANQLGDSSAVWLLIDSIGYIARQRHDFSKFTEALRQGRKLAAKLKLYEPILLARVYEASTHTLKNDFQQAEQLESLAEEIDVVALIENGAPIPRWIARRWAGAKGLLHYKQKDWASAQQWYGYELQLRELTGENPTPSLAALAEVCVRLNDINLARTYLAKAEAVPPTPKDVGWIDYSYALIAEAENQKPAAIELARRALKAFEHFGPEIGKQMVRELLRDLDSEYQDVSSTSPWSEWLPFPDPRNGDYLQAPFGPGVYVLRHRTSNELILLGQSRNVAQRMTSLLPAPLGQGHRSNEEKREYVLAHIDDIEYRTLACTNVKEARQIERDLKTNGRYRFST